MSRSMGTVPSDKSATNMLVQDILVAKKITDASSMVYVLTSNTPYADVDSEPSGTLLSVDAIAGKTMIIRNAEILAHATSTLGYVYQLPEAPEGTAVRFKGPTVDSEVDHLIALKILPPTGQSLSALYVTEGEGIFMVHSTVSYFTTTMGVAENPRVDITLQYLDGQWHLSGFV